MEDTGERLIEKGNEQTLTYGEHLARYNSVLDVVKGKVVLDIAAGSGYGTKIMSKSAQQVIGIDYFDEAVKYSKKHYSARNVTYKTGDAHNLPLQDDTIDVVVSFETIEHLTDPAQFIKEVKRVLKKDGIFIVSTPNDAEFMEGNEFHIHEFNLDELQKLINKNFTNCEFYYQGTWFSAGLLKEESFRRSMQPQKFDMAKTFGQQLRKAIFFIAIASDGPVPELRENIVVADRWSSKENIETEEVRQAKTRVLKETNQKLQDKCAHLEQQLSYIEATKWWKTRKNLEKVRYKVAHVKKNKVGV